MLDTVLRVWATAWEELAGAGTPARLELRTGADQVLTLDAGRWLGPPSQAELALLADLEGPVLDIGCGPGRLVAALTARGVPALGIDIAPAAVRLARSRGVPVLLGDLFRPVPAAGEWATALLMDGSIGIGGDPVRLLRRVCTLLRPGGRVVVEMAGQGHAGELECVQLGLPAGAWATVDVRGLTPLAATTGLLLEGITDAEGRCVALLRTPASGLTG